MNSKVLINCTVTARPISIFNVTYAKSRFSVDVAHMVIHEKDSSKFCRPGDSLKELRHEKTNNVVSEQARHNPSCTSTEDG